MPDIKLSDDLKKEIYEDGLQLPLQSASKTFSDVWFLVFGGISHIADKRRMKYAHNLECYHQELFSEIKKIPNENLIEPSIQVTAQALENSKYCIETKELRALFVNLISKSMNTAYVSHVHPSFAEIIKQMNADDARILKTIPLTGNIPIVDYIVVDRTNNSHSLKLANVYLSELSDIDIFRECASISSLIRLGILNIDTNLSITNQTVYKPYTETPFFKSLADESEYQNSTLKAKLKKYVGNLTPLGQNFVATCVL